MSDEQTRIPVNGQEPVPPPDDTEFSRRRGIAYGFLLGGYGLVVVAVVLLYGATGIWADWPIEKPLSRALGIIFALGGFAIFLFGLLRLHVVRDEWREAKNRGLAEDVEQAVHQIEDASDLLGLMRANRKQMDAYDSLARSQAEEAHRMAFVAMGAGLLILAGGVLVTLTIDSSATKYAAAIISAAGVGASGYVAKTFIRVRESSSQQMTYYFQQPLVQSYLLTAERLASQLPEERRQQQLERIAAAALAQASGPGTDDSLKES